MTRKRASYTLAPLEDGPRSQCRRWGIRVSLGTDPATGKRLRPYETFEGTEREAELRAMALRVQHGLETPTGMTVAEFFIGMYLPWTASRVRSSSYDGGPRDRSQITRETYGRYEAVVRIYIVPLFGSIGLADLKPFAVQTKLNSIARLGARRDAYKTLRQGYRRARVWGLVSSIPTDAVPMPRYDARPKETAKACEIGAVLAAFDDPADWDVRAAAAIGLGVGMRRSEICAIDRQEIDWTVEGEGWLGAFHVWRGYHWHGGTGWFEPPKSRESDRTVVFPRWLGELLRPVSGGEGPLLVHNGERTRPDRITHRWRSVMAAKGLKAGMPFRNTRHSCGTILVREKGVPVADVQQLFGHSTPVVTSTFYVQSGVESAQRAASAMSDAARVDCPKLSETTGNGTDGEQDG